MKKTLIFFLFFISFNSFGMLSDSDAESDIDDSVFYSLDHIRDQISYDELKNDVQKLYEIAGLDEEVLCEKDLFEER